MKEPVFVLAEAINSLINEHADKLEIPGDLIEILGSNAMNMVTALYFGSAREGNNRRLMEIKDENKYLLFADENTNIDDVMGAAEHLGIKIGIVRTEVFQ